MEKFTRLEGVVAPLDRANVDTDAIIPKQFLKSIKRTGFGLNLFDAWRYLDHGEPGHGSLARPLNPDFVLNQPRYKGAEILLARKNFGCGSSREHAPWALIDFGFRCVIAPRLPNLLQQLLQERFAARGADRARSRSLVLRRARVPRVSGWSWTCGQTVSTTDGSKRYRFEVDPFRKHCLLNGLDEIGLTLQHADKIRAFEAARRDQFPWLFR